MSAILFLRAYVRIPCTPRILWANALLTTCALYSCRTSLASWASKSAWQLCLYNLIVLTDVKPTNELNCNNMKLFCNNSTKHEGIISILQVFTAGYTNILIGCRLHGGNPNDALLVRIYGRGTNLMIDRQQERNSMAVLHLVDCAAPVFCRFKNGIAYGFQPGIALDCNLVRLPHIQR